MIRILVFFGAIWAAASVFAQTNPAIQAEAALKSLEAAAVQLNDATKARDRVRALTATVRAFEDGLGAMRDGLRQAAIQERSLTQSLASKDVEIAALLAALQSMGRQGSPEVLLHPSGAVGTARAGMMLAELGPALNASAIELRRDLQQVQTLRALQQAATNQMADGLRQVQEARTALNQAMADRQDLPARFTTDPTRIAILIASAETLDGFASGLSQIVDNETAPALDMPLDLGNLTLPAQGVVLRQSGEADAAGVIRPGVLLATRASALVTSPSAATIRYAGPLLDFGQVVMLEPKADDLIILAGLAQTYGAAGQVIAQGTPVGVMGGVGATEDELFSPIGDGGGTERSETLYIEVRQDNRPVDPATWFNFGPNR
ncbi:MAG: murein hydrolase activator EnvC [Paracoccaceae bacterium]